jgi:preprotein translocase subunit SecD
MNSETPPPLPVIVAPTVSVSRKANRVVLWTLVSLAAIIMALGGTVIFAYLKYTHRPATGSALLQFDLADVLPEKRAAVWKSTVKSIRARATDFGGPSRVLEVGNNQLRIEFFRLSHDQIAEVGQRLVQAGRIEFRLVHPELANLPESPAAVIVPPDYEVLRMQEVEHETGRQVSRYFAVRRIAEMIGDDIENAKVSMGLYGQYQILVFFGKDGTRQFADLTEANIGRQLGIVFDGRLYSAPVIKDRVSGGSAVLTGGLTQWEAIAMAKVLTYPLKVPSKLAAVDGGTDRPLSK